MWWARAYDELERVLDAQVVFEWDAYQSPNQKLGQRDHLCRRITMAFDQGRRLFVAAGGDGTVQLLSDALMRSLSEEQRALAVMGAVGLGSSNDFHRPISRESMAGEWPVRLDYPNAGLRDVGVLEIYSDGERAGQGERLHFMVSASIGVVALGNQIFNQGGGLIGWTKRFWTDAAISLATLTALARHRPIGVSLSLPDEPDTELQIVHLGIMKSPFLAGGLRYDFDVPEDDGMFSVAIADGMGRSRTLLAMLALLRRKFSGRRHRFHLTTPKISADAGRLIPVEIDGEILEGRRLEFRVAPRSLRVCRPGLPPATA